MHHRFRSIVRLGCGLLLAGASAFASLSTAAAAPLAPPATPALACGSTTTATTGTTGTTGTTASGPSPVAGVDPSRAIGVITSGATADVKLPCTPQSGQILIIVVGPATQDPTQPPLNLPARGVTDTPTDPMAGVNDARVDTYAKRQAIRDQYRGRINETTFNDELSDGVNLDQALSDALAEFSTRPAASHKQTAG